MMKDVDMFQTLSKEDKAFHKRPKVGHKGKEKKDKEIDRYSDLRFKDK